MRLLTIISLILLASCSNTKPCYKNRRTIIVAATQGKMIDLVVKLKKENYFKYYEKTWILPLLRINTYHGSYTIDSNRIVLNFCGSHLPRDLNGTGIINDEGNRITLYGNDLSQVNYFTVRRDKRKADKKNTFDMNFPVRNRR